MVVLDRIGESADLKGLASAPVGGGSSKRYFGRDVSVAGATPLYRGAGGIGGVP